jgi:hypothetical protein
VQSPRECELLADTVPYPNVSAGMSAKVAVARHRAARAVARHRAALGQANGNLVATRTCQELQRQRFAGGR